MEHGVTDGEARLLEGRVRVRQRGPPKGVGVFARRDLQAGEYVGSMAGRIVEDQAHLRMAAAKEVSGRYSMETQDRGGAIFVVEPEEPWTGRPARRFRRAIGHLMNEPGPGERLNVEWLHNDSYEPERVDCFTTRRIPKGRELLVHYGPHYERSYRAPFERPRE